MAPKPVASSRPIDIVPAHPRPAITVAIAVENRGEAEYQYAARSDTRSWGGTVSAEAVDAALLDVIVGIRETSGADRLRFLVPVKRRSMLWLLREEVALLMPGVWLDRPTSHTDEMLVQEADAVLRPASQTPAESEDRVMEPAPAVAGKPVCVATDGSVRGRITGYGWLASSGEYGLQGYRHSTKLAGTNPALVTELRAIGMAVQKLTGREITVLSDSREAVSMANRWKAGDDVLPQGYSAYRESGRIAGLVRAQRIIRENRDRVTINWVKGHRGHPLNEGADALARLASRYSLGDSALDRAEYHRRAADLAETFSREFARQH